MTFSWIDLVCLCCAHLCWGCLCCVVFAVIVIVIIIIIIIIILKQEVSILQLSYSRGGP